MLLEITSHLHKPVIISKRVEVSRNHVKDLIRVRNHIILNCSSVWQKSLLD